MVFLLPGCAGEAPPRREVLPGRGVEDALEQAAFGERNFRPTTYHQMIENPHIDASQQIAEIPGQGEITGAGLSHPGGMVMGKNYRSCVQFQRPAQYFPGMYRGTVHGALKQFFEADEPVAVVQKQAGKNLSW